MPNRKRLLRYLGFVGVVALPIICAAGVMTAALLAQNERDAEREKPSSEKTDTADIQAKCFQSSTFDELVTCVRDKTDSDRETQHDKSDLRAQQDVASFNVGILWFAALGFITSGWGLVALIYTFREQRKLTANASRAYLEIISAQATIEDQAGFVVTVEIFNGGQTQATDIRLQGTVNFSPDNEWGTQEKRSVSNPLDGGYLEYVPPRATHLLMAYGGENFPAASYPTPTAWRYVGPTFSIVGKITYTDAFGDRQALTVDLRASDLHGRYAQGITFYGAHSSRKIERKKSPTEEAAEGY